MAQCAKCHKQLPGPDYVCDCGVLSEAARAVGDTSFAEAKRMYAAQAAVRGEPADVDPYYTGRAREFLTNGGYAGADVDFVLRVLAEVTKARHKFGAQSSEVNGLALAEELSEVDLAVALGATKPIKKLLHIREGKSGEDDLYVECVQTAGMAMRLATESEDRREWKGNIAEAAPYLRDGITKRGCNASYEVGSGGHVPGTPGEGCEACDRDFEIVISPAYMNCDYSCLRNGACKYAGGQNECADIKRIQPRK